MDRNWAKQGVKPGSALQAVVRMCLVLQRILVRPARLELATSCFGGKRSIQLSYGRVRPIVSATSAPEQSRDFLVGTTQKLLHSRNIRICFQAARKEHEYAAFKATLVMDI
jgi:hypothetical protein